MPSVSCLILIAPASRLLSPVVPVSCLTSPVPRLLSHASCLLSQGPLVSSHISCLTFPVSSLPSHVSYISSPILCQAFCLSSPVMAPDSLLLPHVSCIRSPVSHHAYPVSHHAYPVSRLLSCVYCLMSHVSRAVCSADLLRNNFADLAVLCSELAFLHLALLNLR